MYENRTYAIITADQVDQINFYFVKETGASTLRFSVDGTKTFVKFHGPPPVCIPDDAQLLTYAEILELLSTPEWSFPIDYDSGIGV